MKVRLAQIVHKGEVITAMMRPNKSIIFHRPAGTWRGIGTATVPLRKKIEAAIKKSRKTADRCLKHHKSFHKDDTRYGYKVCTFCNTRFVDPDPPQY